MTAVAESRKIFQRVYSYVLYRVSATIQIVAVLSILALAWNEVIRPLYIIVLALLNDVTICVEINHHDEHRKLFSARASHGGARARRI